MTERLSQLLHDEAADLTPPPPDCATTLAQGRRLQRRQRVTSGLAATAVAAVVATTAGFVALQTGQPDARDVGPAGPGQGVAPAAYGVGSDIHLGDVVAQVRDTVHSLHYTSLGVLVRSNPNDGSSSGSGPESLTLVRWDGSTEDLGTIPEGVGPATDPDQDVYALAEARGDGFVAVVRDAMTGETVLEQPLPDKPPSFWEVPPLALDDETLYVGYRNETVAVDLTTEEVTTVDGLAGGIPDVQGGRTVVQEDGVVSVRDATTGEVLLDVDGPEFAWGTLSPDGLFLEVVIDDMDPGPVQVYDVASGEVQEFPASDDWGWTVDGGLFKPDGDTLTTCVADTGSCQEQPLDPPLPKDADVRVGGSIYES